MALVSSEWQALSADRGIFYRKFEVDDMAWESQLNLEDYKLYAAPYGGPIALLRDPRRLIRVSSTSGMNLKPFIYLFTPSGREISAIKWNSGSIVEIGWSDTEDLLVVQDDGQVLVYDYFGNYQRTFSMGQEARDAKVLEANIFYNVHGTGLAVLTSSRKMFLVYNINEPKLRRLADIPGADAVGKSANVPSAWTVLAEDRPRVLVAVDQDLYLLDVSEATPLYPDLSACNGPVVSIAVSPNGLKCALFFEGSGAVWIGSADLRKKFCEFDTRCPARPSYFMWCANGAVVGYWDNVLMVIGQNRDAFSMNFDLPGVHLVKELDCVRIYTQSKQEILQRVPNITVQVFKIGSMSPGAILMEASREFECESHKADDYLRMIKDNLQEAVDECLSVARYEWKPSMQKTLLRAANLGLSFIEARDPQDYVTACQMARVLNALRDPKIGMPLTYEQYQALRLTVVLDRLVLRRHHLLAIRIAQFLLSRKGWFTPSNAIEPLVGGRSAEADEAVGRILAHWAVYKIKQTHLESEEIARSIARKLDLSPCISYADIAGKALECGKKPLAVRLLKLELSAVRAVPLLLKLDEDEEALKQSVCSGDTDLVYLVLLHLLNKRQLGDFQMMIRSYPVAQSLYLKYCGSVSLEKLRDMYEQEDNFVGQAICRVKESYRSTRSDEGISMLMSAVDQFKHAANRAGAVAPSAVATGMSSSLGGGIEWSQSHMKHWASLAQDQVSLLRRQISLEETIGSKTGTNFSHDSLTQTIAKLLKLGELKLADKLRLEFKVPDERFFWMRLTCHAEKGEWFEIDKLARMKKNPVGFDAFVRVCLLQNNVSEAKRYALNVRDDLRVKYFVKAGMMEEAVQFAIERKDIAGLDYIATRCVKPSHREIATRVQQIRDSLGLR